MFPVQAAAGAAGVPSGPRVQLLSNGAILTDFQISDQGGSTTEVTWTVDSDGKLYTKQGQFGSTQERYDWLLKGINSDYDVMFSVSSITGNGNGAVFGGPWGSWLGLGSDRSFRFNQTSAPFAFDSSILNGTMTIRDASTLVVLASQSITGNLFTEA